METPDTGMGVKTKINNQNTVLCVGRWIKRVASKAKKKNPESPEI